MRLSLHRLDIPFVETFRHAAAERASTSAIIVAARDAQGLIGYGEGCPRPYVTGETLDSAQAFFEAIHAEVEHEVGDIDALRAWVSERRAMINRNPAAWCAIELALLDLFGRRCACPVEALCGLPALIGTFRYSAVIGDVEPRAFSSWLDRYRRAGFWDFKIKLAGEPARDRAKLDTFRAITDPRLRVRCDANNLWQDSQEAIRYLRGLDYGFFAIEEPVSPGDWAGLAALAEQIGSHVILDESVTRLEHLDSLREQGEGWVINLRVSKLGGLLRTLEAVERARRIGIAVIVGAQVGETSLLTRAAMTAALAADDVLIAQEGAFGTRLLQHEICTPVLMFGAGGALDVATLPATPGWGLDVSLS